MLKRETLIGILVTILFHLIIAMIIVSIRIRNLKTEPEQRFEMNIARDVVEQPENKEKTEEVNKEVLDQIYKEIHRQENIPFPLHFLLPPQQPN